MKRTLTALAAFLLPAMALANTVQVYPTIVNAHGGNAQWYDMPTCISIDGTKTCSPGNPTADAPIGSVYGVTVTPPAGYSYSTRGDCSGTVAGDEASIICFVDYADGAPVAQQAPQTAPSTSPAPISQPAPILTAPAASTGVFQPSLPAPIVLSTTTDATTTPPTIDELRAQLISLIRQLIAILEDQLAHTAQ